MKEELLAARGAICLARDDADTVDAATSRLLSTLAERNAMAPLDCVFILFSVTDDIRSRNPATAAREAGWDVPLFCVREAEFEQSPQRVLRVLVTFRAERGASVRHAYLEGAEKLRPDLPSEPSP